jgi:hypothetical protein
MDLSEGRLRDLMNETLARDTNVICHQSDGLVGNWEETAWCAGSVEMSAGQSVRIADRLGVLLMSHPDDMEKAETPDD